MDSPTMTEVSLKEHLETQIKWLDRHFESQIKEIDRSTAKAAATIDTRLQGMNEFRDSLRDQAARFATKSEMALTSEALSARIKSLELDKAATDGKTMVVSGLVAFVASILVVILSHWLIK